MQLADPLPIGSALQGAYFTVPVSAGLAMVAHVDATSTGKTWFSPAQNNQVQSEFGIADCSKTERDAFTLVNARWACARIIGM